MGYRYKDEIESAKSISLTAGKLAEVFAGFSDVVLKVNPLASNLSRALKRVPPMSDFLVDYLYDAFDPEGQYYPDRTVVEYLSSKRPFVFTKLVDGRGTERCEICGNPTKKLFTFVSDYGFSVQTCARACGGFLTGDLKSWLRIMFESMNMGLGLSEADMSPPLDPSSKKLVDDAIFWSKAADRKYVPEIVSSIISQFKDKGRISDKQGGVLKDFIVECRMKATGRR